MKKTHIATFRDDLVDPLFKKPLVWHFWGYCKLKARRLPETKIWNKSELIIEPCEFIIGRKQASDDTGLSQQNIRTAIKTLVNLKYIEKSTSKSTNQFSVYKIITEDIYEILNIEPNQPTNQPLTSGQPATNQPLTTNKKVKKEKNVNNKYSFEFEEFWKLYPKNNASKFESSKSFDKAIKVADIQTIMAGLKKNLAFLTTQANKPEGNFCPHATTWLNNRRWEIDPPVANGGRTLRKESKMIV